MKREYAEQIKFHALQAIEHLNQIVQSPDFAKCPPEVQARLKRAAGTLIGETEVTLLQEVYAFYPEMDDLK